MSTPKPVVFVAVDLEMEQPSNEIISVGIAFSHPHDPECVAFSHNFYVTPTEPLSEFIQQLTGLRETDFDPTKSRDTCFAEIATWINARCEDVVATGNKLHKEFVTWGCGDVGLLRPHIGQIPLSHNRFTDVKTLAMLDKFYSHGTVPSRLGLSTAMSERRISPIGTQHNSESDAVNTLHLFGHIVKRERARRQAIVQLQSFS